MTIEDEEYKDRQFIMRASAMLTQARSQGCVCTPEFKEGKDWNGIPMIYVLHDEWCPLLRVKQEEGPNRLPEINIIRRKQ